MREGYERVQKSAFDALVRDGTYDESFEHAAWAQRFFSDSMAAALQGLSVNGALQVLECGCGPGAWLQMFAKLIDAGAAGEPRAELYGFDITPAMVDVARRRLQGRVPSEQLQVGDVLQDDDYAFGRADRRFDLVFAYDVIQQLPRSHQFDACRTLVGRLKPGGVAVVFDHDRHTRFGRIMGWKKFVTRYTGVELVPRYFCNARYPALRRIGERLARDGAHAVQLRVAEAGRKRALIISRRGA